MTATPTTSHLAELCGFLFMLSLLEDESIESFLEKYPRRQAKT